MGKYYNGKLKSIDETKVRTLVCTPIILAFMSESLTLSCAHPHSIIKVPYFFKIALRDAARTVHLVGQRIFRVGESISYRWKSSSICSRNSACFLWNSASLLGLSLTV